jgi:RNA-directed DNA polymerase
VLAAAGEARIVELGLGKEGFVFLGCYLRIVLSLFRRREYLFRWPALKAMNRVRARIRALTDRRRWAGMNDIRQVVEVLNPVLRGWGNCFRTGNASWKFQQVDRYVNQRLVRWLRHVRGWRRRPFSLRDWSPARLATEFGLHRLVGTVRYPGFVHAS